MAIQTSGTTRISNSGQLQNIGSLDATTISTISSAAGGSPVPDWANSIYFNLNQSGGNTNSTAATNVAYSSSTNSTATVTITGAGNGTIIKLGMGGISASYARTFYILHSSGNNWHRNMSTTPWSLTRNYTSELTQGSIGGLQEFDVFVASGATVRLRTNVFNLVSFTGFKVDL